MADPRDSSDFPMPEMDETGVDLRKIKKRAGRPKDLAAVPYIEATIRELQRTQSR